MVRTDKYRAARPPEGADLGFRWKRARLVCDKGRVTAIVHTRRYGVVQ